MAADDDATSLTIDMINNFDVTNVITENLEFYIYFTELADGLLTVEELQEIIDLANALAEINTMAEDDDASELTIQDLIDLGIDNVIAENLDNYIIGIENADGVLTLEELQAIIDVANLISVNENSFLGISIYPNPSNGIFTIETEGNFDVTITDISGKVIQRKDVACNVSTTIDLTNNANGIYFIKFQNNEVVKTIKIIKQ